MPEMQTVSLREMLGRMTANLIQRDKMQAARILCYTVLAGIAPFFAVALPKIAIGILEEGGEQAVMKLLAAMGGYLVLAGAVGMITTYLKNMIFINNMKIRLHYLGDTFEKLVTMDYCHTEDAGFYEKNDKALSAGSTNTTGIEGIYNKLSELPAQVIEIVGMAVVIGALNLWILLALICHVMVTVWVSRQSHNYSYSKKEEVAKVERKMKYYYRTTHDFSFGKDIRIYNFRERILKNYESHIESYAKIIGKIAGREYLLGFVSLFTLLAADGVMYGILIAKAYGGMPISSFSMYLAAAAALMAAMLKLGESISFIQNQGQYVCDFYRLMDEKLESQGGEAEKPEGTLEIVFEDVGFRYPGSETDILKHLNFTIHKGERLAIVGVNGAGKSTMVKLMTGLFEPTEGHIYINGREIREYPKKTLYQLYSAVFQDVNVFAFTLRENVACSSVDADDQRVRESLEKTGLWKKVEGFSKGLDTMMLKVIDENGTDFSGGERQKLSIARGLYKGGSMVIMDEPTAALDALAEAEIYEQFSSLVEGKTAVYISHRLASTRFCDKIALFDKEGLREYGTHEELMEQKGEYYRMFLVQGKYYQKEGRGA
ncbi:MAG: ABC transporter ATP-binding protein [Lachnospiraceae bacterium]|nr:ABC transporter ATP-binding protein [Lachnospiraceae bacterium]